MRKICVLSRLLENLPVRQLKQSVPHLLLEFQGRRLVWLMAPRITVDEVKRRMESGEDFTFIDVRNPASLGGIGYDAAESDPTAARQARRKPADTSEVQTHSCVLHLDEGSSASLAQKLQKLGHKDVWALQRGFRVWQNAGLPFREAA